MYFVIQPMAASYKDNKALSVYLSIKWKGVQLRMTRDILSLSDIRKREVFCCRYWICWAFLPNDNTVSRKRPQRGLANFKSIFP